MKATKPPKAFTLGKVVKLKPGQDIVRFTSGELIIATFAPEGLDKHSRADAGVVVLEEVVDGKSVYVVSDIDCL